MRKWLGLFMGERSFRREFKREFKTLLIVTLGFTIAFTWRQTIFDLSLKLLGWITNITDSTELSLLNAFAITLISLALISLTSYFLRDDY